MINHEYKKTKTLVFGDRNIEKHVQIAGSTIENVEQFEYLGSLLSHGTTIVLMKSGEE